VQRGRAYQTARWCRSQNARCGRVRVRLDKCFVDPWEMHEAAACDACLRRLRSYTVHSHGCESVQTAAAGGDSGFCAMRCRPKVVAGLAAGLLSRKDGCSNH
jgi:hypothetical protein